MIRDESLIPNQTPYWASKLEDLFAKLSTSQEGLSTPIAVAKLRAMSSSSFGKQNEFFQVASLLLRQFLSPIILILIAASTLSLVLGQASDALIIIAIVVVSGLLGFWQEWQAASAIQQLLAMVQIRANVLRDGKTGEIAVEQVVPGDVIVLSAGDMIPGDGRILEANGLFVAEASLTGETFPVEKKVATLESDTTLALRTNCLFLGTSVASGTGKMVVVLTGKQTEFGKISESLRLRAPETEFERGIRRFGYLLLEVTLVLVLGIFAVNVGFHRPVLESFLFSIAIAVGLTPQLLPAIISVNLAHGARRMAREHVIVRRLASIENLGGMDVFCSDKTGTLTEGKVKVHSMVDIDGNPSEVVKQYAYLNAKFQSGYANPIDAAILAESETNTDDYEKLDEEPYDFVRKRLSVLVRGKGRNVLITKGALANILDVCTKGEGEPGVTIELAKHLPRIDELFKHFSGQGFRTLGVAYRDLGAQTTANKADEAGLTFLGLMVLEDPLREGIAATLNSLKELGITTKLVTGDNRLVASHVASQAGLTEFQILTGTDLRQMSDEALIRQVSDVAVFAEVEPNQKERIIVSLQKAGHVVGYMGDGINDASALHAADVGISVADAVDVAKGAADFVLMERNLDVLISGVREGRATFANTIKYVFMATSANFGNMFSLAGASLFLPFLPLLAKQVLLLNLLADLPEMTIATDRVDPEMVDRPRRWDLNFIRRFMIVFGIISSFYDFATFAVLGLVFHATEDQFRTAWFLESVISSTLIVLVVRTRRPFYQSRPSRLLLASTLLVILFSLALPYTPLATKLGFISLSWTFYAFAIVPIVVMYVCSAEVAKRYFYVREPKTRVSQAMKSVTG